MGEGRGTIPLEEVMSRPREGVACDRHRPEEHQPPGDERSDGERQRQQRPAHMQPTGRPVGVLTEIERIEVAEAREPGCARFVAGAHVECPRRALPQRSTIAVTPMPPAVQTEIRPRLAEESPARSLARVARMRVPVAAKGWPSATLPPFTVSLLRSTAPSGPSSLSTSRQYSGVSHALSVHSTCAAKASWIS